MKQDELVVRLKEQFTKDLPNCDFETFDKEFLLSYNALKDGFVNPKTDRFVCTCIMDMCLSWNNYLQSLLIPNPHNPTNIEESNAFTEDEKHRFGQLISHTLAFSSENALLAMKMENRVEFIGRVSQFWLNTYKPELIEILAKLNKVWVDKSTEEKQDEPKHYGGTI